MLVLGIDNGKSGYMAGVHGEELFLCPTPAGNGSLKRRLLHVKKDNAARDYRPKEMLSAIDQYLAIDSKMVVILEEPTAGFKKGKSSAGSRQDLFRGVGIWEAVLAMRDLVPILVHPTSWKAYFKLVGQPKEASMAKASEYFDIQWPCDDAADATLLALFFLNSPKCKAITGGNTRQKAGT